MSGPNDEEIDGIFTEFLKNETMMKKLREALVAVHQGFSNMNVCLLQIRDCDARSSECFSQAACDAVPYKVEGEVVSYTMGSIFSDGVAVLKRYLNEESPEIPHDKPARTALKKILMFLTTSLTSLTPPGNDQDECTWAVQLAQHLLSELAVESKYTLDSHYTTGQLKKVHEEYVCPCGKNDKVVGSFGDTSFGCSEGWHGRVDILMENLPVSVVYTQERETRERRPSDSSDDGYESPVEEVKASDDFATEHFKEMLAQCIVFSFLQKKHNDRLSNYLIPSLGICKRKAVVHFYDCENDVLLGTAPLGLFVTDRLSVYVVVFLWLTLNYQCFCSGVTEDMMEYKSDFFDRVGDYLEQYKNNVTKPCEARNVEQDFSWAEECGRLKENVVKMRFMKIDK